MSDIRLFFKSSRMNWNEIDFFPVMGLALDASNTMKLDFSPLNQSLERVAVGNTSEFNRYVFDNLKKASKTFGVGGYLEYRAIYQRSGMFATAEEDFRNIHLGVDIWTEAGASVFAPFQGKVISLQDNSGFGNYGPTIILEHEISGRKLFSLYGHLTLTDLDELKIGQEIVAGQIICHVGPFPENGDWPPHLHFQLMWNMEGNQGDYPGVCSKRDLDRYSENCPDPNFMLKSEVLNSI